MRLFEWYNLVFYIPIAFGLLMGLGMAFGLGHGHDVHGHAGHDAGGGHGHHGGDHGAKEAGKGSLRGPNPLDLSAHEATGFHPIGALLNAIGFGKVPFTVVLVMAGLLFGGAGIMANMFIRGTGLDPGDFAWLTIPGAVVAMFAFTGTFARGLNRLMPTFESYNVTKADLVGQVGLLVLPTDAQTGLLQVKDRQGTLHQSQCRSEKGALPNGTEVLVVEYLEDKDMYLVEPYSLDTATQPQTAEKKENVQ